jgi:hypothetical protein
MNDIDAVFHYSSFLDVKEDSKEWYWKLYGEGSKSPGERRFSEAHNFET